MQVEGSVLSITGIGAAAGSLDVKEIHTGESGLLTRLMIPLLSVLCPERVRVTGVKCLLSRELVRLRLLSTSLPFIAASPVS